MGTSVFFMSVFLLHEIGVGTYPYVVILATDNKCTSSCQMQ